MELADFCAGMGFDANVEKKLSVVWNEVWSKYDENAPDLINLELVSKYYPLTDCRVDCRERLEKLTVKINKDKNLRFYAFLLHYSIFLAENPVNLGTLPLPEHPLGKDAGLFQFLVAMTAYPLVDKQYEKMGLPEKYAEDFPKWLGGTMEIFRSGHDGELGHDLRQTYWLRYAIDGKLFRIGRLEYLLEKYPDYLCAIYQNCKSGQVKALCRNNWFFESIKQRCKAPVANGFVTTLIEREGQVEGSLITPDGRVDPKSKTVLNLSEWRAAATPWDIIPTLHIPAGGGMTREKIKASLLEAKVFFREYLKFEPKLFCCCSWILNPDWEVELPESNLTDFMRQCYMLPGFSFSGNDGVYFVFGRDAFDEKYCRSDNSLHRAFAGVVKSGRKLQSGVIFITGADIDAYGTEYYRKNSI